jgi:ComEC/Rec2-related protein
LTGRENTPSLGPLVGIGLALASGGAAAFWIRFHVDEALDLPARVLGQPDHGATELTHELLLAIAAGLGIASITCACLAWHWLGSPTKIRSRTAIHAGKARAVRASLLSLFFGCAVLGLRGIATDTRQSPLAAPMHIALSSYLEGSSGSWLQGDWSIDHRRSDGRQGRIAKNAVPIRVRSGTSRDFVAQEQGELSLLSLGNSWLSARSQIEVGLPPRVQSIALDVDALHRIRAPASDWNAGLRDLRRGFQRRCLTQLPQQSGSLAAALLLGDRSGLDPALSDLFTRTGTRHLLSLSGLHVSLIAALIAIPIGRIAAELIGFLLRSLRITSRKSSWTSVLSITFAAVIIISMIPLGGGSPPVARAAVALALARLAPILPSRAGNPAAVGRGVDACNLWGMALLLECVLDPRALTRVGVQLSYGATLALLVGMRGMKAWMQHLCMAPSAPAPVDRFGRTRSPLWLIPATNLVRWIREGLAASTLATIVTVPICWLTFGELAPIGILATTCVVPLLSLMILAGWSWLLFPWWVEPQWIEHTADALILCLEWSDLLPWTPLPLPPRPSVWVISASAFVIIGVVRGPFGSRLWLRTGAIMLGIALLPWRQPAQALELVVCDVGHGTAVLMRAPGLPALLFDAGSRDRASLDSRAIGSVLRRWEVDRLWIVLSHEHRDHASALPWVIERWSPSLWVGALPDELKSNLPPDMMHFDIPSGRASLPLLADAESGLEIELIRGLELPGNEGSRNVLVHFGGQSLLLTGDAEGPGLEAMLHRGELDGPHRLLLAPHHGSDSLFWGALLKAAAPQEVWVSAAARPAIAGTATRFFGVVGAENDESGGSAAVPAEIGAVASRGWLGDTPLRFTARDGALWLRIQAEGSHAGTPGTLPAPPDS